MAPLSADFTKTSLMKQADIALYEVKYNGRNAYKLYQEGKKETQHLL